MDAYKTLELKPGATQEDAKRNFRRLSLLYHPDKKTGNIKKFQEILEAYNNFNTQLKSKKIYKNSDDFLYLELNVSIEDLYLEKEKTINYRKSTICYKCEGTGSYLKEKGICRLCQGKGEIKNHFINLMKDKINKTCPLCGGSGIKPETECKICKGNKTIYKKESSKIKLHPGLYFKKFIILDRNNNIYLRLKIEKNPIYHFEGKFLIRTIYVTPAQHYAEDFYRIEIFGKTFKFQIPPENDEVILYDKRSNKIKGQILLQIEHKKPILNEKTKKLYKLIAKEEKK